MYKNVVVNIGKNKTNPGDYRYINGSGRWSSMVFSTKIARVSVVGWSCNDYVSTK
jgi:hypothetical protein